MTGPAPTPPVPPTPPTPPTSPPHAAPAGGPQAGRTPAHPSAQPPSTQPPPLSESDLALPGLRRGKVRDVYDLPSEAVTQDAPLASHAAHAGPLLLMVASDRISAFDVVMPTPIAGKGALLTRMSVFWLRMLESRGICSTHLLSDDVAHLAPGAFARPGHDASRYAGRIMICRKTRVVPIECVVRGYLEGSGWKEYRERGSVCGVSLPSGLRQCDQLPEPIFTPATKEEAGKHDQNISFERACELVGAPLMERLRRISLAIYREAAQHARDRGIIIADTKFEFGVPLSGQTQDPILIDEVLTPDSSRFWPADDYQPGRAQRSFDKQYLREYLEDLVARRAWNKEAPGPALPDAIVRATHARYAEACDRLLS